MKPIPANLAQQKAYSQYFPLPKAHSGHVDYLLSLNHCLQFGTKIEES